jgi:ferritin-like metal-binding protein YciE
VKKISNPKDLVIARLAEILWVERRLAFDVLPKVIGEVGDEELRGLFDEHLGETRQHVERVEAAFHDLGMEPSSAFSPGLSALVEHHDTVAGKIVEPHLKDRWHALSGIAVEHFELALYTGLDDVDGLGANQKQEAGALKKLERWLS